MTNYKIPCQAPKLETLSTGQNLERKEAKRKGVESFSHQLKLANGYNVSKAVKEMIDVDLLSARVNSF